MVSVPTNSFKVPAKKEFSIPLRTNIPLYSLFYNKNLGGFIGGLFSKEVKVQYLGDIK